MKRGTTSLTKPTFIRVQRRVRVGVEVGRSINALSLSRFAAVGISTVLTACILIVSVQPSQAQPLSPQSQTVQPENSLQDLQKDLTDIFNDPNFSNAFWGVTIQSLETGQYFFRLNDARSFLPASNMKLLTSAEALNVLGPDFRYTTQLVSTGRVTDHTLKGDVIVRGAGDPTLGAFNLDRDTLPTTVFEGWADSLKKQGITRIEGNIVGDDSYFTDALYPSGWAIEDMPYYYAMQ